LVGGSSGAATWAAVQVAKSMQPGQRVVVILPDSIRNYLSKFVSDAWMRQHGFVQSEWELGSMADVLQLLGPRKLVTLDAKDRLSRATALLKEHGISQLPILDGGRLVGILTELDVMRELVSGRIGLDATVAEAMVRKVVTVKLSQSASELVSSFERGEVALVVDDDQHLAGLITKLDLIELLGKRGPRARRAMP
jgi:cystathionine beta-synthase